MDPVAAVSKLSDPHKNGSILANLQVGKADPVPALTTCHSWTNGGTSIFRAGLSGFQA
jgi:hypothetical protein